MSSTVRVEGAEGLLRAEAAIIADDLTGACDASLPFARSGIPTVVTLGAVPAKPAVGVLGVTTETREAAAGDAATRVAEVVREVLVRVDPLLVVKKVDSLLRGPVGAELAAAREAASAPCVVLAPALPRFDRTVSRGVVSDANRPDVSAAERIAQSSALRTVSVPASRSPAELASRIAGAAAGGADVVVCDASDRIHLQTVARAVTMIDPAPLLAGSADLTWAIAEEMTTNRSDEEMSRVRGERILFVLGSLEPRLRRQLDTLRAERRVQSISLREVERAVPTPAGAALVLESVSAANGAADDGATAIRLGRAAKAVFDAGRFDAVVCAGGRVAAAVCDELGITALSPVCELTPGFVACRTGVPAAPPVLALRSGGFGGDGDLRDAYDCLTQGAA